jgi:hypothetical protein
MVEGFDVRRASDFDREDIIRLITNMRIQNGNARYGWMYLSNPHGRALTWLAIERGTDAVVGCTSLFPRRVLVDGKERMGSIGGDCYIDPRVRRRRVATALHRASFDEMQGGGVDFMYGPPAIHNLHALLKAGSHLVTNCDKWAFLLSLRALYHFPTADRGLLQRLIQWRSGIANLPGAVLRRLTQEHPHHMRLKVIDSFGTEFDRLFDRTVDNAIMCIRDREYLTWRYLAAPGRQQIPFSVSYHGELMGFVVLEIVRERASIIDLFAISDRGAMEAVIQAILDHAAALGCCIVDLVCTSGSFLQSFARRRGFIKVSEAGFQVATGRHDPQLATLLRPSAWHFTMGDTDLDITVLAPQIAADTKATLF